MFHRTERLLLRPAFVEDAPELARAIADEGIVRNLASAPWPYREDDARAFIARDRNPRLPEFVLTMRTQGTPRIIGACGIGHHPQDGLELGYWIARPYWGLGFATEAARAVTDIARATGIVQISASHYSDNYASGRVLRKLGFRPTGRVVSRHSAGRGKAAPCLVYELGDDDVGKGTGEADIVPMDDFRETIRLMAA